MLTVKQIFDNMVALLGVTDADQSSPAMRAEAFIGITTALQQMQVAGEDYYCREEETVSLAVGVSTYVLDKDIQTVLDHPRIGSRTLKKLTTRSRYDNYGPLFLGTLSRDVPAGTPLAYFVECLRDDDDDNAAVKVLLVPPPAAVGSMLVPVIKEPPAYTTAALCDDTVPPVPHQYHESILLPLCRWEMTNSSFFTKPELIPALRDARRRALVTLGVADPREQPRKGTASAVASADDAQPTGAAA